MADYSDEEKNALAGIFALYDQDKTGFIEKNELEGIRHHD
jgi:Ca2+-binding EF-hand superfamily protein